MERKLDYIHFHFDNGECLTVTPKDIEQMLEVKAHLKLMNDAVAVASELCTLFFPEREK